MVFHDLNSLQTLKSNDMRRHGVC